mgnify:CR=1 FL=1
MLGYRIFVSIRLMYDLIGCSRSGLGFLMLVGDFLGYLALLDVCFCGRPFYCVSKREIGRKSCLGKVWFRVRFLEPKPGLYTDL